MMRGFSDRARLGAGGWSMFVLSACALGIAAATSVGAPARELPADEASARAEVQSAGRGGHAGHRPRLLAQLAGVGRDPRVPAMCFVDNPTPAQLDAMIRVFQMRSPVEMLAGDRFNLDNVVWTGNGLQSSNGNAARANLTMSFPADGTTWGAGPTGPNSLRARFTTMFGAGNEDRGFELIRQAFAGWERYNGLVFSEVADNNSALDNNVARQSTRGDIRVGGISDAGAASQGVLAYNFFPNGGGDMTFIDQQFTAGLMANPNNNYRYFRNVVAHELGHGIAFAHVVPCSQTKLMEPQASSAFEMVQIDDRRGAGGAYGDRYSGNNSAANARDLGDLTSPSVRSVIERDLSTNGSSGPNGTNTDWFRFTLGSTQNVVITVQPTGGTYSGGSQTSGCNGSTTSLVATQAGNLNVELRSGATGGTILQSAASAAAGSAETITANNLAAGTYFVRVVDVGPNANQTVQLYDLTCRVANTTAVPVAVLGINKRIQAGQLAFFLGNINSYATQAGATLTTFEYDTDGNGTYDITASQTSRTYVSNGVYTIGLRVTDSNARQATDTIQLTVFGASTSVTSVLPSTSVAGATVPITINGANFKGVTSAAAVQVSGTGVTVTGTPEVNPLGTQITGLSLVVNAGAPIGARNITITNADGLGLSTSTGVGTNLFSVTGVLPPSDECASATAFSAGGGAKAFSNVNATNSAGSAGPWGSCTGPMNNDVWHTWQAPGDGTITVNTNSAASGFSTRVSVFSSTLCPPVAGSLLGCAEFGQTTAPLQVLSGQTVLFQVGSSVPNATGSASVIINFLPATGACCNLATGACIVTTESGCGLNFQGNFTTCSVNACPLPTAACCFEDGSCSVLEPTVCGSQGGVTQPGQAACFAGLCPLATGACCSASGTCSVQTSASCVGTYLGNGSVCAAGACPEPTGACCNMGACQVLTTTGCATTGGVFQGGGVSCGPSTCPPATGACCRNSICVVQTQAECSGTGTSFSGAGSACNPAGNATTPCCKADFDRSGSLAVTDIFAFLNAWFGGEAGADFSGNGSLSVQDIFDFLGAWFAGC
jgi:Matrixin/Bacterial pre-peptidase C-terminal domain/PKD domain